MIINLLPAQEKRILRRRYYARVSLAAALLFGFVTIVSAIALLPGYVALKYGVVAPHALQNAMVDSGATTTALTTLTDEINAINQKINIVNGPTTLMALNSESILIERVIATVRRATAKSQAKATLTSWHFVRRAGDQNAKIPPTYTVTLSGIAENRAVVLALATELKQTEGIIAVDNPIQNYVSGKNSSFTMSIIAQ